MNTYSTQSEYVIAKTEAVTRTDLDRLAARLSETGTPHRVWRDRQGNLVVFTDAYRDAL